MSSQAAAMSAYSFNCARQNSKGPTCVEQRPVWNTLQIRVAMTNRDRYTVGV